MMKSQFSYRTYIFVVLTFFTIFFPVYLFINRIEAFGDNYNLKFLFLSSLLLLVGLRFVFETIKRILSIKINNHEIIIKNILLSETKMDFKIFDGFETTIETSKSGDYEMLYLIKNKKSLVHISEFHLANYKELKSYIETKVKNLGYVPFSFVTDWKRFI